VVPVIKTAGLLLGVLTLLPADGPKLPGNNL